MEGFKTKFDNCPDSQMWNLAFSLKILIAINEFSLKAYQELSNE